MIQKRLKSPELRRREAHNDRCNERHPIWHSVRCTREASLEHFVHHTEGFTHEWVEKK